MIMFLPYLFCVRLTKGLNSSLIHNVLLKDNAKRPGVLARTCLGEGYL